ncbi:unnamed protein product [Cochlearia groenlandica]
MNKLVANLDYFLISNVKEVREAEMLRESVASVNIEEIKEFKYEPSNPDDIYSIFEEMNLGGAHDKSVTHHNIIEVEEKKKRMGNSEPRGRIRI